MMSGGQCPFCKPARTKIFQMRQAGMDDSAIIASFLREFGARVFRPDPSSSFWLVPYFSLGAGGILIVCVLKRASRRARRHALTLASDGKPSAGSPGDADASFARYCELIEEDASEMDSGSESNSNCGHR